MTADEKKMLIAIPARMKVVASAFIFREKMYSDNATNDPAARAEKATEVYDNPAMIAIDAPNEDPPETPRV
jgi:hypothetical protein